MAKHIKYALIDIKNNTCTYEATAKSFVNRNIERYSDSLKDVFKKDISFLTEYHKAYFDNLNIIRVLQTTSQIAPENSIYSTFNVLINNYFDKGFYLSQHEHSRGIINYSMIMQNRSISKIFNPGLGLDGDLAKVSSKETLDFINTRIEVNKLEGDGYSSALKNLKKYIASSNKNANSFGIIVKGNNTSFFIYIHD